jgi:hypothetical protein
MQLSDTSSTGYEQQPNHQPNNQQQLINSRHWLLVMCCYVSLHSRPLLLAKHRVW